MKAEQRLTIKPMRLSSAGWSPAAPLRAVQLRTTKLPLLTPKDSTRRYVHITTILIGVFGSYYSTRCHASSMGACSLSPTSTADNAVPTTCCRLLLPPRAELPTGQEIGMCAVAGMLRCAVLFPVSCLLLHAAVPVGKLSMFVPSTSAGTRL